MPKIRMSLLNVTPDVSALKFRTWIKNQAADIQRGASDDDVIVIRLFMPIRLIGAITQSKLDRLLSSVVDAHPSIHRIELIEVEQSLSVDQMQQESEQAKGDLAEVVADLGGTMSPEDVQEDRRPPTLH